MPRIAHGYPPACPQVSPAPDSYSTQIGPDAVRATCDPAGPLEDGVSCATGSGCPAGTRPVNLATDPAADKACALCRAGGCAGGCHSVPDMAVCLSRSSTGWPACSLLKQKASHCLAALQARSPAAAAAAPPAPLGALCGASEQLPATRSAQQAALRPEVSLPPPLAD